MPGLPYLFYRQRLKLEVDCAFIVNSALLTKVGYVKPDGTAWCRQAKLYGWWAMGDGGVIE